MELPGPTLTDENLNNVDMEGVLYNITNQETLSGQKIDFIVGTIIIIVMCCGIMSRCYLCI